MVPTDRLSWGTKWHSVPARGVLLPVSPTPQLQEFGCQELSCGITQSYPPLLDVAHVVLLLFLPPVHSLIPL